MTFPRVVSRAAPCAAMLVPAMCLAHVGVDAGAHDGAMVLLGQLA